MKTDTLTASLHESLETARENLERAQERLNDLYENAHDKVVAGAKATDRSIRKHPYESAGIALGVGVLIGVLLGRNRS